MTTTRKPTPAQARKAALESDFTPLYAMAGLTDVVNARLQTALSETGTKAGQRFASWQAQSEKQAKAAASDITVLVKSLPDQVKALPDTTKNRLAEWQKQVQALLDEANQTYVELAGRGKKVVDDTLVNARVLAEKVEERADVVRADVADRVDPAFEAVQETVVKTRRTVTGRSASESVISRSAAKQAARRAETAATDEAKVQARKAAAKRAAATRAAKKAEATRAAQSS